MNFPFDKVNKHSNAIHSIEQYFIKKENARRWVRVAGISGFVAIILAAYGDMGYYYLIFVKGFHTNSNAIIFLELIIAFELV